MPRPNKSKIVGQLPRYCRFFSEKKNENVKILLLVEEFETIRLIDHLGMTQEECAASMKVGRATVQSLYTSARGKLARYLVEGGMLEIGGGNFAVEGTERKDALAEEGHRIRIAVPWEDGKVFPHFGRARCFKIYNIQGNCIADEYFLDSGEYSRRMLAELLDQEAVQIVICGGIGAGARNALGEKGIRVYPGAEGEANAQVQSFLEGGGITDRNHK